MKRFSHKVDPLTREEFLEVSLRGRQLIECPLLNKGTCFPREEREELELLGLLPHAVSSPEQQVARAYENYSRKTDDLEKYIFLLALQNRNETLFYRLLTEHLDEMVPIVYTPTVGKACQTMSHIFRQARGIYIHPDNVAKIDQVFANVTLPHVRLIVVTDGERILGLGDLGSDGMGIPIGKVNLYVGAGGLHPSTCLPIMLDVGTNNEEKLKDPFYLGWRHPRLRGQAYDDIVETFVTAVKRHFPDALLQWEDFGKGTAFVNLERYRDRILSFNDDIQGTGSTACGAFHTAMRIKKSRFGNERFMLVGFGQAGTGIAMNIRAAMIEEGLTEDEARRRIFAVDMQGLLVEGDPLLEPPQVPFAQPRDAVAGWKLDDPSRIGMMDVLRNARPTVLIGVTAKRGMFDEAVLKQMAANSDLPVIMALSNPTSKVECTPEEVAAATGGRFLMATGSPFPPVKVGDREIAIGQSNNMFVFPAVGLGALVAGASKVTDRMFVAASKALSAMVTPAMEARGLLLPPTSDIREVSFQVALAVAKEARDSGIARRIDDETLATLIRGAQWVPRYLPYRAG